LSRYVGIRGRAYAGLAALLAAIGFAAMTSPWLHGVMLLGFAVVGMGLFIAAVWTLSAILGVVSVGWSRPAERLAEEEGSQEGEWAPSPRVRHVHVHSGWSAAAKLRRPRGSLARRMLRSAQAEGAASKARV
jgi:hypothetical protein